MDLCTSLSKKVESLESELKQTKQTYNAALTKLIKRVKKLEQIIKTSQDRRRAKVVISDDEEADEILPIRGRSFRLKNDLDAKKSLVPLHVEDWGSFDETQISDQPKEQLDVFSAATALANAAKRRISVENVQTYIRRRRENQGGYKMSHFKGMSYKEIRPIFEKVWDQIQSFVPMDSEKEKGSEKKTGGRRKKLLARKRARETLSEESAKKQKLEDDAEKEELQVYLNIVPEEESLNIESLATKQDVLELYILVKDRFQTASLEGYDLLLWGDLKTLIEPNEEDEI
ncbi:hypothetical protein Tco_0837738 [Tanacetum coccineum]